MRLVLVVWEDASQVDDSTWVDRASAPKAHAVIFHQVGWLESIDETAVVLTTAVSDQIMAARDRIPLGMVKTILELDPATGVPVALPKKKRKRA